MTAGCRHALCPHQRRARPEGQRLFPPRRIELPGTVCGNNSQYKFYVHDTGSPNVLFLLEGGGACWDYDTCSGRAGRLGAANPNGISDDYIDQFTAKYVSPIVNGADPGMPLRSRTDLGDQGEVKEPTGIVFWVIRGPSRLDIFRRSS